MIRSRYGKQIWAIVCWLLIQTFFLMPEARAQTYCTTNLYTNGCSTNDRIDLFTFGTINNPSSTCTAGGYSDYTNLVANVNNNGVYNMSMQANAASAQGFAVWIDYNQDNDFDDVGEMVYSTTTTGTQIYATTVQIPGAALPGTTRLRVRSIRGGLLIASSSCTPFSYGETEDYTVTIAASTQYCTTSLYQNGCSTSNMINEVQFAGINTSDTNCNGSNGYANRTNLSATVQMGSTYPLSVKTGAIIRVGVWIDYNQDNDFDDPGEFIAFNQGGNLNRSVIIAQNALPGTTRMRVRTNPHAFFQAGDACSQMISGETEDFTLHITGQTQYCTANLHNLNCGIGSNPNNYISSFSLGSINNNSTCSANGYGDYTSQSVGITRGTTQSFTITSPNNTNAYGVWIDLNKNLQFDIQELVYQSPTTSNGLSQTASFTIPATAALGNTRLRVRAFSGSIPQASEGCTFKSTGETEDYTLTILALPSPIDVGVTTITRLKDACGLGAAEQVSIIVKNLGTTTQTNFTVGYSVNGTSIATQTVSKAMAPGDTTLVNFSSKANLSTPGVHTIKAWTNLANDAEAYNDSTRLSLTNFGNGISTFPATETFETFVPQLDALGNNIMAGTFKNGWSNMSNDNGDWMVSGPVTRAKLNLSASGDHTTGTGNYLNFFRYGSNTGTADLESPCITLTSLQTPTLEFWYHLYGGTNGSLAIDINEGGNWNLNVFTLTGSQQSTASSPWLKAVVPLTAYSGKSVRLRFRATITSTNSIAVAIDDLRILDLAAALNDVGVSRINTPITTGCDKKAAEEVCVNLTNFGNTTRKNFQVGYKLNNLAIVSETFADSLLPGQTKQFCFATKANLLAAGTYTIRAFSSLAGDQDLVNDTVESVITNIVSQANFTFMNTTGTTYQFTTQSVNSGSFIKWYFGDGDSTTTMMPTHQYQAPGTYTVTMKAVDFQGCLTTVQKVITVTGGTALHDIGAVLMTKPVSGSHCSLTTTEQVCVNLTNYGNVKQKNFSVYYKVNNQAAVSQQFTDSIMPNQTKPFCFSAPANLSGAGIYAIKSYTNLPNDLNRNNDTARVSVTNKVPNLTFTFSITSPTTVLFTPQNLSATAPVKWYFGDGDSAVTVLPTHTYPAAGTYTVTLKGTDLQGCIASVQQTVNTLNTGINETVANTFKLYPNPATTFLMLKFSERKSAKEVEIVSVLGQKVKSQKIDAGSKEVRLGVQELPAGTYLVRITEADKTVIQRLIIQK
ncbi:PKD domain-containing protein [Adhaeribacter sp. BT258]|uniref:PKD domain-containing protein n=1 Tax=Adhaeribacter terrigena TaxID=2793070 RepID=A0ABS1BWV7_9BACT|nr:GEVED domain-containing protein [Adhaeribacter terrigena]MBK0401622.1 PKD domain-containing protein [Adhaeribacter terrigena]